MTKNTTASLVEGTIFMAGITFLGGFMDAYTFMTRGGIFANNQTGNMAKLGIHFAQQNWKGVNECFFVMFCCVLGACFSQVVQHKLHWFQGDWRKRGLLLLAFALFLSGFVYSRSAARSIFISAMTLKGWTLLSPFWPVFSPVCSASGKVLPTTPLFLPETCAPLACIFMTPWIKTRTRNGPSLPGMSWLPFPLPLDAQSALWSAPKWASALPGWVR